MIAFGPSDCWIATDVCSKLAKQRVNTVQNLVRRATILSHVSLEAFEPTVCTALGTLGYDIVEEEEAAEASKFRFVDEEEIERSATEESMAGEIVVLTRNRGCRPHAPRVIDSLEQPVAFRVLYALVQRLVEPTPRADPRVTTMCPARCTYADEICFGSVISISEGGCLFRCYREPPDKPETELLFALPPNRRIELRARTVRREKNLLGLRFNTSSDVRSTIGSYVMDELLAN